MESGCAMQRHAARCAKIAACACASRSSALNSASSACSSFRIRHWRSFAGGVRFRFPLLPLISSKMLGGASQIVSMTRVKCNSK